MSELPKISVLMPAYNEGGHIRANLEKVRATLEDMLSSSCKDLASGFEIVVVNDGSADNTKKEIETAAARCDSVVCVNHQENRGGAAAERDVVRAREDRREECEGDPD